MLRRNINMDGLSLSRRSAFLTAVLPLSVDEWGSGAFTVGDCAGKRSLTARLNVTDCR